MSTETIFGYFTDATQETPAFDPGLFVPCPVCLRALNEAPRVTTSLFIPGDDRSFFFRAHKPCWDAASDEEQERIEHSLIDARLAANGAAIDAHQVYAAAQRQEQEGNSHG